MTDTCLLFANTRHFLDGRQTAPAIEPLSPGEIVEHARANEDEATVIADYISAARAWVENQVNLALGQRTVTLYMDEFPSWDVELRFPPLNSVTSIVYLDSSGTSTTLSTSLYRVDTTSRPPRITPAYGQFWPVTYSVSNAVTITASVGYTTTASVPQAAKQAIRYLAAMMYENREPTDEDLRIVNRILDPIRWEGAI